MQFSFHLQYFLRGANIENKMIIKKANCKNYQEKGNLLKSMPAKKQIWLIHYLSTLVIIGDILAVNSKV